MRWASALDLGVALDRQQVGLGVEEALDALAEGAPVVALDLEMAAEVEQGALADLVTDALGADEAEGEVLLAITGAGASATDEHTPREHGAGGKSSISVILWYYISNLEKPLTGNQRLTRPKGRNSVEIAPRPDKHRLDDYWSIPIRRSYAAPGVLCHSRFENL